VAFNTFVADAIPLEWDVYEINTLTENILHSWEINQEDDIQLEFQPSTKDVDISVDAIRFEHINVSLLYNDKYTEKEIGIHNYYFSTVQSCRNKKVRSQWIWAWTCF